jgi:hypothetical protein
MAAGVDDLHDDVRSDVDVVGHALGGGHGAGITAQRGYHDRVRDVAGSRQVVIVGIKAARQRCGRADIPIHRIPSHDGDMLGPSDASVPAS